MAQVMGGGTDDNSFNLEEGALPHYDGKVGYLEITDLGCGSVELGVLVTSTY